MNNVPPDDNDIIAAQNNNEAMLLQMSDSPTIESSRRPSQLEYEPMPVQKLFARTPAESSTTEKRALFNSMLAPQSGEGQITTDQSSSDILHKSNSRGRPLN